MISLDPLEVTARVVPSLYRLRYETWNYGDSVAFEAMLAAGDLLDDERLPAFAYGWMRAWATRARPYVRLDSTAPGLVITQLARRHDDALLLQAAYDLAGYLMSRPRLSGIYEAWTAAPLQHPYGPGTLDARGTLLVSNPPPGVFVDNMHFEPPFFAALAAVSGDQGHLAAALDQARGYIALLQPTGGTFSHFALRNVPGTFGHGWGRGQGWALLGLLDVLDELRPLQSSLDDAQTQTVGEIAASAAGLVDAQVGWQRDDGHWYAVVDDPRSGDEHSTAAFMSAGFYRALEAGVVSGPVVEAAADAAYAATCAAIDADGTLTQVSAAVMACTEQSHYAHVPRGYLVPWGQGPIVLAAAARAVWRKSGSTQPRV